MTFMWIGLLILAASVWALRALSANVEFTELTPGTRVFPMRAATRCYKGGLVGIDPAGHAKPFEPGDLFAGIADAQADNSSGAAGAIDVAVRTDGTFLLALSGATDADAGKAVYAASDADLALSGHPDGFVGRVIGVPEADKVYVRLRAFGERPGDGDDGSKEIYVSGTEHFVPTGAGASATVSHPNGLVAENALGLGVLAYTGEGGGVKFAFDATAEIALATLYTQDSFPVDRGITMEADVVMDDKGDNAAIDFDFGLGTLLTANSKANIDHADMVDLAAFHMDGNSDNILAQSDDNVTDVAPVDTTIDNDSTTDVPKRWKIIVRPTGAVEFWINGARVLSSTTFAVRSTVALAAFVNLEKTSDDTTCSVIVRNLRIAGGRP